MSDQKVLLNLRVSRSLCSKRWPTGPPGSASQPISVWSWHSPCIDGGGWARPSILQLWVIFFVYMGYTNIIIEAKLSPLGSCVPFWIEHVTHTIPFGFLWWSWNPFLDSWSLDLIWTLATSAQYSIRALANESWLKTFRTVHTWQESIIIWLVIILRSKWLCLWLTFFWVYLRMN